MWDHGVVLVTFSLLRPDARKPVSELCGARDGGQRTVNATRRDRNDMLLL